MCYLLYRIKCRIQRDIKQVYTLYTLYFIRDFIHIELHIGYIM